MIERGEREHDGVVNSDRWHPPRLLGWLVNPVVEAVDPDAVLARVDVNELVDRVDLDATLERVDVDRLVERIDLNALLQGVDVNALVARIDLNALLERVDLDALVQRIDVEGVVERVDVAALIERVDIPDVVSRVRVADVVTDSASQLFTKSVDAARLTLARVDGLLLGLIDRLLRRDTDPARARFAGPISRFAGWIVDSVVVSASFTAVVAVGGYLASLFSRSNVDPTAGSGPWWVAAGAAWWLLYFFLTIFLIQRTLGMAVIGNRVTRGTNTAPHARDSLIRAVVMPFSFILGLGFIGCFFGRRRRALHDVAAGTVVISDTEVAKLAKEQLTA